MNRFYSHKKLFQKIANIAFAILLVGVSLVQSFIPQAHAVAATGYIRTDRMKNSTTTGGQVCFTEQSSGTDDHITITFPGNGTQGAASYGVNSTAANWTTTYTNIPSGASAMPITGDVASGVSGAAVTFALSGNLVAATQYCFNFTGTSTLSTPTSAGTDLAGSIISYTSGAVAIDTINLALAVVNSPTDQIAVTATVPATFSFALGGNTAALSTLSSGSVTSATGITVTVSTNANNGWLGWVKSANGHLTSPSTSDTIDAGSYTTGSGNIADLSGTTGYVLDADATTGSPTIATEYDGNTANKGGKLDTAFEQFASKSSPQSGNVVTLIVRAKPSATNKAASDYADTLTVVGAGQF